MGMTWGDQLALGIVRDGELISRKVNFERMSEKKLAATKPASDDAKKSASSLGSGIGSMLGGFFSGKSKSSNKTSSNKTSSQETSSSKKLSNQKSAVDDQVVSVGGSLPSPAASGSSVETAASNEPVTQVESAGNFDDPLGFGDDEPIEQVIFQKKTNQ